MLFSELYNDYFNTIAAVISKAIDVKIQQSDIEEIIKEKAFKESAGTIIQKIRGGKWPILQADGSTIIQNKPTMPLTILQKQWINAIANDPRIQLFGCQIDTFPDVEPLFTQNDYYVFDKHLDGDDFKDPHYIECFQTILTALRKQKALSVSFRTHSGEMIRSRVIPQFMEYSEKEDKFRLICSGGKVGNVINVSRILTCEVCDSPPKASKKQVRRSAQREVVLNVVDHNNALERVLLHFSHYRKEAVHMEGDNYQVKIYYDKEDETELVIRVLSFGASVKVLGQDTFMKQMRDRLMKQKSIMLNNNQL